jgi:hypothetical protein
MMSGTASVVNLNMDFRSIHYFQGSLSLPMMYTKQESDKQSEQPAVVDFLVKALANKATVGITTTEYVSMMRTLSRAGQKDSVFGNFESHDFNEEVIMIQQRAHTSLDHLAAVHSVKPYEILEILGGYKLLYPVFEKSLQSNLPPHQKAEVWKYLFKILRTFMNTDPSHVLRLYKNKLLIESLKSCVIRAGLKNLLTKDLLVEIITIVRDVHTNPYSE